MMIKECSQLIWQKHMHVEQAHIYNTKMFNSIAKEDIKEHNPDHENKCIT